ncbi:hypothetical protein Heshes_13260 [Alicyclobacillus hesperidum]|uniref:Uncharacterized protein YneR n=1 Tax=Alicyclobacillus hesperidum TaxID=89784 RepID=A0A1H2XGL2_9BACL|nr:cytoplasmic protein [Alicyclobacillus hesperidum]GLV13642.1 hypothetical protein Heshes_13260 [Alicyclobacillus hesperidum]SDW91975.1 Uncharacterized protein YneR [Alicyclobacillus hesperidum]
MKIVIDPQAAKWMESVLNVKEGDGVRFKVRYGGHSTIQPGFSLGLSVERPENVVAIEQHNGRLYFVRDDDAWYFDGRDLYVDYLNDEDGVDYRIE